MYNFEYHSYNYTTSKIMLLSEIQQLNLLTLCQGKYQINEFL